MEILSLMAMKAVLKQKHAKKAALKQRKAIEAARRKSKCNSHRSTVKNRYQKIVKLDYVSTKEQIVDIFTKPLAKEPFEYLRDKLGVVSVDTIL